MKKIFFFILLFSFNSRAISIYVGNGGGGVYLNNKLYLQDLVQFHNYESPYIGNSIDEQYLQLVKNLTCVRTLNLDPILFAQKLTDLDKSKHRLGFFILNLSQTYNWLLVDQPLEMDCRELCPNEYRQIAVRHLGSILISKKYWKDLNPAHRIALIIHEMLSSSSKLFCNSKNEEACSQHRLAVQELVGLMFQENSSFRNLKIIEKLNDNFMFNDFINHCNNNKPEFTVSLYNQDDNFTSNLLTQYSYISSYKSIEWEKQLTDICEVFAAFPSGNLVVLSAKLPTLIYDRVIYNSDFGFKQFAIKIKLRLQELKFSRKLASDGKNACLLLLQQQVRPRLSSWAMNRFSLNSYKYCQ